MCHLACLFCGGIAAELLQFVLISGRASLRWRVLSSETQIPGSVISTIVGSLVKELPFVKVIW